MGPLYRAMAERYHWPANVVAELTFDQINMYLEDGRDPRTGRPYVEFATTDDYLNWLKKKNNG